VAGVVAFQIPLRLWQQAAPWLFLAGVALLLLVLMPMSAARSMARSAGSGWARSTCSPRN
jgi:cell division protein FtsW (lipid II flippase)